MSEVDKNKLLEDFLGEQEPLDFNEDSHHDLLSGELIDPLEVAARNSIKDSYVREGQLLVDTSYEGTPNVRQLSLLPDGAIAYSNDMLRSALFGPIKRGPRPSYVDQEIYHYGRIAIVASGKRLDTFDQRVLGICDALTARQNRDVRIRVPMTTFLKELDLSDGEYNRKRVADSLDRLSATSIKYTADLDVEEGRNRNPFKPARLVDASVSVDWEVELTMPSSILPIYERGMTYISKDLSEKIGREYTKANQSIVDKMTLYVLSWQVNAVKYSSITELEILFGSDMRTDKFRQKISEALKFLSDAGVISEARMYTSGGERKLSWRLLKKKVFHQDQLGQDSA